MFGAMSRGYLSIGYLIYFIQQMFIAVLSEDLLGSFAGVGVEGITDFFFFKEREHTSNK